MIDREQLLQRGRQYAERYGLLLADDLGAGVHGIVLLAKDQSETARSAVKIHGQAEPYQRERDIYLRLGDRGVKRIRGCEVPQLVRFDDELRIIEMTIVTRPFVLDFAGAYLDTPPTFPDEVMADWLADKREQFGRRWPDVEAILRELVSLGIFMEDVSPSNIGLVE